MPYKAHQPKAATFGRHESFPLRFGWITKGLEAIASDPSVFSREDTAVILGVGKNMAMSIHYWLHAARIVQYPLMRGGLEPTPLGNVVFGQSGDPYLEDDATIWLLHWLLATNPRDATAIYWFFNHFHKSTFSSAEATIALTEFVKRQISLRVSAATLKRDVQMVLRMYAITQDGEESLDSPLGMLGLQERINAKKWRSVPSDRAELPLDIFAFALAETFESRNQLAVHDLMYSSTHDGVKTCSPGAVFRMTETGMIEKLEAICDAFPKILHLDRTAGVFQLYKTGELDPLSILKAHYAAANDSTE